MTTLRTRRKCVILAHKYNVLFLKIEKVMDVLGVTEGIPFPNLSFQLYKTTRTHSLLLLLCQLPTAAPPTPLLPSSGQLHQNPEPMGKIAATYS